MVRLAKTFRKAFEMIHGDMLTMLDVHEDFQHEVRDNNAVHEEQSGH
jgi:hypothetical protein